MEWTELRQVRASQQNHISLIECVSDALAACVKRQRWVP